MSLAPKRPRLLVAAIAFALGAVIAACGDAGRAEVYTGPVQVHISALAIDAEQARTQEDRAQGLSGRESLAADAGMLFVFEAERRPGFWMREMQFPLDFIWISAEGVVVNVKAIDIFEPSFTAYGTAGTSGSRSKVPSRLSVAETTKVPEALIKAASPVAIFVGVEDPPDG